MICTICNKEIKEGEKYTAELIDVRDRKNGVAYYHIQCLKKQANKVAGKNNEN